jgi:hypothetical protein
VLQRLDPEAEVVGEVEEHQHLVGAARVHET